MQRCTRPAGRPLALHSADCPAVEATVEAFRVGRSTRTEATVRDLDGCAFTLVFRPEEPAGADQQGRVGSGADTQAAAGPRSCAVNIYFAHAIPFAILDQFSNFDAYFDTERDGAGVEEEREEEEELWPLPAWKLCWRSQAAARSGGRFVAEMCLSTDVMGDAVRRRAALEAASRLRVWALMPLFTHVAKRFLAMPMDDAFAPVVVPSQRTHEERMAVYIQDGHFRVALRLRAASGESAVLMRRALEAFSEARRLATGRSGGLASAEAGVRQSIGSAPGFTFAQGAGAPQPLSFLTQERHGAADSEDECVFWCVFYLSAHHLRGPKQLFALVTALLNFRHHVLFHMHATQSAMHALLRTRVESHLRLLGLGQGAKPPPALCPAWEDL